MFHNRRKRLAELAAREAAGESLWTDKFDDSVRTKILYAWRDSVGNDRNMELFAVPARNAILRDEGLHYLHERSLRPVDDFLNYLLACPDEMVPTVVEVMAAGFANDRRVYDANVWATRDIFKTRLESILREHRITYELIDGQMVEFSSREMHVAVTVPVLSLLGGRKELVGAESAYKDALDEISKGKPSDAITDAGTALQEVLTALGCSGNALGPLIKSARANNLLASHDNLLAEAITKAMHWVSADRSESGDAHGAGSATVADAWLIVHITGALILRLAADGDKRGS